MRKTDPLARQQARYRELKQSLGQAETASERARLGAGVSQLYQEVEQAAAQLAQLLEEVRRLAQSYDVGLGESAVAPDGLAPPPPSRRSSEVGALVLEGWGYIEEGDHEAAHATLRKALHLAPDDPEALSSLGWAQTLSRDYDNALATYHQLLVVNPDDALARVNLGYICLQKRIYGEAIEHLSRAIRDSSDPKAAVYGNHYLGLVYLARDMYGDAEMFFLTTVALQPAMCQAYFQLGRVRYLLGRKADAISAWRDGAGSGQFDIWATRCAEAARAAESGSQPLLD